MPNLRRVRGFVPVTVTGLVVLSAVPAVAAPGGQGAAGKVTICHRTNSITNPYVLIEVAASSVDGDGANDNGQGDHYVNHDGPIWTPSTPKRGAWGDIIPPVGNHQGLNWTAEGQAILESGCSIALYRDTDKDAIIDVQDSDDDNDRVPDAADLDDDGDGSPDASDPDEFVNHDSDNDGAPDVVDSDDDNDKVPDVSDPDDDGDGTPDSTDPDESSNRDTDGDAVPDQVDSDDDNDGIPDTGSETPQEPVVPATPSTDTDDDGAPDVLDVDDDGDGIKDVDDSDADGDGTVETLPQELTTQVNLPKAIEPGKAVVVYDRALRTSAGARPLSAVTCAPMTRMRPAGDVGVEAMTRDLCEVRQTKKSLTVRIKGLTPTVMTFTVAAPAHGAYAALDLVQIRIVR